ncbi:hypothetical protein C6P45_001806 [Maudiozyma exigua]|uniref:DNA repair metallo-beta-lactamase domain-containing protein n=1 Tax=Maudiozyma exigua TaxID=34358 RepID=A0A9P6WE18_MAUEX|nr:hypothetical protein C6P45_001806 [Kazachstania exigua]
MVRKSLVNIRNSDVRYKTQRSHLLPGRDGIRRRLGSQQTTLMQTRTNRKRQRRLFEYDIPTTANPRMSKRVENGVIDLNDDPIIIEEDEKDFQEEHSDRNNIEEITEEPEVLSPSQSQSILNDEQDEQEVVNVVEKTLFVGEEVETEVIEMQEKLDNIESIEMRREPNDNGIITCPICNCNLSTMQLYEKEAHCEACLENLSKPAKYGTKSIEPTTMIISDDEDDDDDGIMVSKSVAITSLEKIRRMAKVNNPKPKPKGNRKEKNVRSTKPKQYLPSIKILTFDCGYRIVVDGFNFAPEVDISKYFLSHFHSDHYIGLKKSWEQGTVYCSQITSDLLQAKFKTPIERITVLRNNERHWITDTISVIPYDANHCPGAQVYLFQEFSDKNNLKKPLKQFIHTGDFRSNDKICEEFTNIEVIDGVYLDTTYLSHTNNFPLQREIVDKTSEYVREYFIKKDEANAKHRAFSVVPAPTKKLVLVGAYAIGKEKLATKICERLNCHCFVYNQELRSYYMDCGNHDLNSGEINVHLVPLGVLKNEETILKYLKDVVKVRWLDVIVIGIIPTGWTYGNMWESKNLTLSKDQKRDVSLTAWIDKDKDMLPDNWFIKQLNENKKFQIFKVPYSEHSSFMELIRFATCGKFKWNKMLATVNLENLDRARDMAEWFNVWKTINDRKFDDNHI